MFKNFFKRAKAAPATQEPVAPAPVVAPATKKSADAFREEFESSFLLVEGKGSESDWAAWAEAEEAVDIGFAPTLPTPLGPE